MLNEAKRHVREGNEIIRLAQDDPEERAH